jgi:succinyl-diaminopimelate desuccinylase
VDKNTGALPKVTEAEIGDILFSLLRTDTSNPPGGEKALALFIQNYLRDHGMPEEGIHLIRHSADRASLVVCLPGRNRDLTLGFAGHLDTVPSGNIADWHGNPFDPVQRDGMVYGRGAADMKGGLAAMIALCLSYLRRGPPPVNVHLFFTADEEAGGIGIRTIREAGWFENVSFLFVCEPTDGRPAVCEKGLAWYDFTVAGKGAHAAMPNEGLNAIELGYACLGGIKQKIQRLTKEHPLLGNNTFSITQMSGGIKINVIPDQACFSADIRLVPPADQDTVEEIFLAAAREYAEAYPGLSVRWKRRDYRTALETDSNHPAVAWLTGTCGKKPAGIYYFTDASLVIPYYPRLPFIIMGPGNPGECHRPNEKIAPPSIEQTAGRYYQFIETADPEWFRGSG